MGYLASPLWMAQLLVGIVLVLQSHYIRPEYFTKEFSLFPAWPRFDYERALRLFELTIGILLAPKFLGLAIALLEPKTRRGCGGALALIASTIVEIIISAALAAVMMLIQSGSVAQILSGRDTGWNPQRRDDGSIPFRSIARRHRAHTVLGLITLFAAALISPSLIVWMSPTIAGLIFSIPLSWASGSLSLGLAMRRIGLLRTPEETSPPHVVTRANALAAELALTGHDHDDALETIWADPGLRAAHEVLPRRGASPPARRRRRRDRGRGGEAQRRRDDRRRPRLAQRPRASRRPQRPGADRAARPAAERRRAAKRGLEQIANRRTMIVIASHRASEDARPSGRAMAKQSRDRGAPAALWIAASLRSSR